jgi:hypothetical protein
MSMATIDLCMDCVLAAGINPARGQGRFEGCDACLEQQKRASRYELAAVVAALVARSTGR